MVSFNESLGWDVAADVYDRMQGLMPIEEGLQAARMDEDASYATLSLTEEIISDPDFQRGLYDEIAILRKKEVVYEV